LEKVPLWALLVIPLALCLVVCCGILAVLPPREPDVQKADKLYAAGKEDEALALYRKNPSAVLADGGAAARAKRIIDYEARAMNEKEALRWAELTIEKGIDVQCDSGAGAYAMMKAKKERVERLAREQADREAKEQARREAEAQAKADREKAEADRQRKAKEAEAEAKRKAEEDRKKEEAAAADAAKRAETEYDADGLVLMKKTVTGSYDEFSTTITGTVVNRRSSKLTYAQITYHVYDASGAKVGTALANINGLEPGARWNFKALALVPGKTYKFDALSGF
jgi:hypothetical protein